MIAQQKIRLGDLLIQSGLLTQEQLEQAIEEQSTSGVKLGKAIINKGFVTEEALLQTLSSQLGIPFVDIRDFQFKAEVVQILPEMHARRFHAIILEERGDELVIGMADSQDIMALDEISQILNRPLSPALVQESVLLNAYDLFYDRTEEISRLAEQLSDEMGDAAALTDTFETEVGAEDAPVVKLLQSVFEEAQRLNASDVHIEPGENRLLIRLRVDGVLREQVVNERQIVGALTQRLKLMAGLNIAERRLPQDGRFNVTVKKRRTDVRLSTMPIEFGESVVMRLMQQKDDATGLDALGIPDKILKTLRELAHQPHGMILVTGPTGSGKTTTLYGLLHELNQAETKIITVEDPVEYRIPRICQVQVNTKVGLNFGTVLKATLRQDPDILMVGEIRDAESAGIALRAAMTGHLVLATLHTNDALSTAMRLIDMGVESYLVAVALRGILAQRLVRRICTYCKQDHSLTDYEKEWLQKTVGEEAVFTGFKTGRGCTQCSNIGYSGRVGVYELLKLTEPMMDALRLDDSQKFREAVHADPDMRPLALCGLDLALAGETSLAEVMRVSEEGDG